MSEKALELLIEAGLDEINIDVKGDKKVVKLYCNAEVGKIPIALIVEPILIKRYALSVLEYNISKDKRCPNCKKEIPIVGKYLGMFSS